MRKSPASPGLAGCHVPGGDAEFRPANARLESNHVLSAVMLKIMADNIKLYKQYFDNADFKKWFSDMVFNLTYNKEGKTLVGGRK